MDGIQSAASECVDDRRWQWLTSGNLARWFDGYKQILHERGFIEVETPTMQAIPGGAAAQPASLPTSLEF